jgi:hypothetical protein
MTRGRRRTEETRTGTRGQEKDRKDLKSDNRTGEGQKRSEEGQEDRRSTGETGRGTRGQG